VIGGRFSYATGGYPFTLGIASGQPSPDGFVLWTRLAVQPLAQDGQGGMSEPISVTWEIAADDKMRNVIRSGTAEAHSQWAHSIHIEVGCLEPARPYWYRFAALGEQSRIGLARTAPTPAAKVQQFRFAFASCSNWQAGYFSAYRHMAAESPDLIIFLGDYIYEYTATGANGDKVLRKHDGSTAVDLASYRNRYALYRTDPDLQALHAAAPCLMTWDDMKSKMTMPTSGRSMLEQGRKIFSVAVPPRIKRTTSTCRCARNRCRRAATCACTIVSASETWQRSQFSMAANIGANSHASCRTFAAAMSPQIAVPNVSIRSAHIWAPSKSNGSLRDSKSPTLHGILSRKSSSWRSFARKTVQACSAIGRTGGTVTPPPGSG
jgi:hypothetical protein